MFENFFVDNPRKSAENFEPFKVLVLTSSQFRESAKWSVCALACFVSRALRVAGFACFTCLRLWRARVLYAC